MTQLEASTRPIAPPRTRRLRGRWLLAAKAAWAVATVLSVGLSVAVVPVAYTHYQTLCAAGADCNFLQLEPQDVLALQELGLSVSFYAAYLLAVDIIYVLGFWAIGAVIFWKRPDDWLTLFFSLMLMTFGASIVTGVGFANHPGLDMLAMFVSFFGYALFYVSFFVFPDGRFVPRWGLWPVVA